ncbi:MAG TPA: YraN family protein [Rhodocyclaceae bacterium]|nr:YraN family protein [Rhodocyclaceae bacterium]
MAIKPDDNIRQRIGAAAEELAARHLLAHGLRILDRNYRVRGGEIDLIAEDKNSLIFVEVRLRTHKEFGGAGASITVSKQRRIILAAQHYLLEHGERNCRFDCILLNALDANAIEWIPGAFSL